MSRFAATIPGYGRGVGYRRMEVMSAVKKPRSHFCHLMGGRELNKFDVGEGDFAILGLEMSKKTESGKCRTSIYSNFLMIAEK
jgi:hypothetical protein